MENVESVNGTWWQKYSTHEQLTVVGFLCKTLFEASNKVFIQQVENNSRHVTARFAAWYHSELGWMHKTPHSSLLRPQNHATSLVGGHRRSTPLVFAWITPLSVTTGIWRARLALINWLLPQLLTWWCHNTVQGNAWCQRLTRMPPIDLHIQKLPLCQRPGLGFLKECQTSWESLGSSCLLTRIQYICGFKRAHVLLVALEYFKDYWETVFKSYSCYFTNVGLHANLGLRNLN